MAILAAGAAVTYDLSRPAAAQWTGAAAVAGIRVYQRTVSPVLGWMGFRCRFEPSCSRYATVAIRKYGLLDGGWRSLRRIARCGPWTPAGTVDPP